MAATNRFQPRTASAQHVADIQEYQLDDTMKISWTKFPIGKRKEIDSLALVSVLGGMLFRKLLWPSYT
jgi:hypothetical protein